MFGQTRRNRLYVGRKSEMSVFSVFFLPFPTEVIYRLFQWSLRKKTEKCQFLCSMYVCKAKTDICQFFLFFLSTFPLVGFGNLRFAEIKSCPSASPTYELRKVEISSKNDPYYCREKNIKKLTFYYFRLTYIHTN